MNTPETAMFSDFEEVAVEGRHSRAGSFEMDVGLDGDKIKSIPASRPRLFNNVALPISSSPIKSTMTIERPKLERKATPLVLPMMRSSGLFDASKMTPISSTTSTTKAKPTSPSRPKLTRKLTPHPEFDLTLANSTPSSINRKAPTLSSSIVEEQSEDETDDETEEVISIPNLPVRGRPMERKTWRNPMTGWNEGGNAGMRRFSSVIEEGKVWLAV